MSFFIINTSWVYCSNWF